MSWTKSAIQQDQTQPLLSSSPNKSMQTVTKPKAELKAETKSKTETKTTAFPFCLVGLKRKGMLSLKISIMIFLYFLEKCLFWRNH
ncbi:hypothetical protein [Allobaculum sp. JKK-2023]|uniref:hypothetical protein n=1 Tax=Allobaculum sp. JKK-2023 TaxID=3108943 RepID=UPI002B05BAD6|nr:hypothetical protein [Allobaculum sp. JKK-2023]